MKTWMITPLLLCVASLALAADKVPAMPPGQSHTPPAQLASAAKPEAAKQEFSQPAAAPVMPANHRHHKAKRLPKGDLRKCLGLKDNAAVIGCAEGRKNH